MRTASCSCGQLSVRAEGEPIRISLCNCLNCQRRSGSVFAVQARWPTDRVTIEGSSHTHVRAGDEGTHATFHFCATCGTTVYFTSEGMPDVIAIPVGTFADPQFPRPQSYIYEVRRHPWVTLAPEIERLD